MKDLSEIVKTSFMAFLIGVIPALLFQAVASALAGFSWLVYIIYALVLLWAVPKLPKEADTFFDILVVTFMLLGFSGLVGAFMPTVVFLQWVNVGSVTAFLTTLVFAIVALAIKEEYVPL